jgi:hypothetical protein
MKIGYTKEDAIRLAHEMDAEHVRLIGGESILVNPKLYKTAWKQVLIKYMQQMDELREFISRNETSMYQIFQDARATKKTGQTEVKNAKTKIG